MDLDDEITSLRWSDAFVLFKCSIREVETKLLEKKLFKNLALQIGKLKENIFTSEHWNA